MSETLTVTQEDVSLDVPWNVVLHDDPVNLISYVTLVLMRIFGYPENRAAALVSEAAHSFVLSHILREQAAAVMFLGLMSLWCIFNYDRRHLVHLFLMVFTFLLAAIHWFDFLTGHLHWMSPLYNSVPFLVLLFMAFTRETRKPKPLERP